MTLTSGLFFLTEFSFKFLTKIFFLKISVTFFSELYYETFSQKKKKQKNNFPWKLQWLKTVGLKWQIHKLFLGICLKDEFYIWLIQH